MHLILLLLSSLFLGFVSYYAVIRMQMDLRRSFVVLMVYRYGFFILQSIVFYAVYQNQLDSFFYQNALMQLVDSFKKYPADVLYFFTGDYTVLHISQELKEYFGKEIRATFFIKVLSPFYILSANNKLNTLSRSETNDQYDPGLLFNRLYTLSRKLEEQQLFLGRYFSSNTPEREKLFFK